MMDELVRRVADAGASHVNLCALRLRVTARRRYLPFIEQEFPHLAARYRTAYAGGSQVSERYRDGLRRFVRARCREHGIRYGMSEDTYDPAGGGQDDGEDSSPAPAPCPEPAGGQLTLALDARDVSR
jgi:hypothetical protein